MDDSLISFEFSDSVAEDDLPVETESFSVKDQDSYNAILASTKEAFSSYKDEMHKSLFPAYFAKLLKNCQACIPFSLEGAGALSDSNLPVNQVIVYLNDAISLLHMMTELYKSISESVPMSVCSMEAFPTWTGDIIFSVFVHCRDSESLYGNNLKSVEKELKDLFRICHNLQMTYLMILEKHFVFDLSQEKDKTVLFEAVKINLDIGEVVQSLDVKTMAEQWKAYTLICEKYAEELTDIDIVFHKTSQVLCKLTKDNIATVEKSQDEKVAVRSLKVASFTIKILIKICHIFKQGSNKNYNSIVKLLQCINLAINNARSLDKSLASLMNSNVAVPSDCLIKELLADEQFVNCLLNDPSVNGEDENNDEVRLGLVLVIATAMKCSAQANRRYPNLKISLIECVYRLLTEHCNTDILFRQRVMSDTGLQHCVFNHILINTTAMALTMTNDGFVALEKRMIGSILSTDCMSALFSAQLWVVLARHEPPQLLFNQLVWLCTMYKKLVSHEGFYRTPQHIQFSYTLSLLFKVMDEEDQLKICKQFRVHDEDNAALWTAVKIRNLPLESQGKAEEAIVEKLKNVFKSLHEIESPDLLISITNLAATCTFKNSRGIDDQLVRAWLRCCQENQPIVLGLESSTLWFYDYVRALVALTDTVIDRLRERSDNFVKVLHVIHGLIRTGDSEMKLILTNILCKLASSEVDEHRNLIDSHFTEAFMSLLHDSDDIVRNSLFITLRSYKHNVYIDSVISTIVREDVNLQEIWHNVSTNPFGILNYEKATNSKYKHKCLVAKNMGLPTVQELKNGHLKEASFSVHDLKDGNLDEFYFDSGGSEIVETEEPCSKKVKPNVCDPDNVITSLEENVSLLSRHAVYTPEQLVRIRNVCEMLKNISH